MVEFKRIQLEKGIRQVGPDRWEVQVHIGRDPRDRQAPPGESYHSQGHGPTPGVSEFG
jgi:hypothetical protein